MKFYAGIGSRETPSHILTLMCDLGRKLALDGWTLRSGHADGADQAFEKGADLARGKKQIWLPWDGFNGAPRYEETNGWTHRVARLGGEDEEIAAAHHPAWNRCSRAARLLHTRNVGQILGSQIVHYGSVNDPDPEITVSREPVTQFVVCWTKDGRASGGTGQAIRLAQAFGIPVHNLFNQISRVAAERYVLAEADLRGV